MRAIRIFDRWYKLIVFDVDGVLLDLYGKLWEHHTNIAHILDLPAGNIENARRRQESGEIHVPLSLEEGLLFVWPVELSHNRLLLGRAMREWHQLEHDNPYHAVPGAVGLCDKLYQSGVRLGLCTSTPARQLYAKIMNAGFRWQGLFSSIADGDNRLFSKPQPEFLLHAVKKAGVYPDETLYVGDTLGDAEMAMGANVDFIGVLTGCTPDREFLRLGVPASHILDSVSGLADRIEWDSVNSA